MDTLARRAFTDAASRPHQDHLRSLEVWAGYLRDRDRSLRLGITFGNAFSREYEDQADRVGLRYVYEGGYDYTKGPALWRRFAAKYGDQNKIENFFFGDHSLSTKRAAALEKEIANYHPETDTVPAEKK